MIQWSLKTVLKDLGIVFLLAALMTLGFAAVLRVSISVELPKGIETTVIK